MMMNSRRRKRISKHWWDFLATYPGVDMGLLKSWERLYSQTNWEALLDITEKISHESWRNSYKNPIAYTKSTILLKDLHGIINRMNNEELNKQWNMTPQL